MIKANYIVSVVLLLVGVSGESFAGLRLSLRVDPSSAVEFEAVTAYVSIANEGDQIFTLDEADEILPSRLFFIIEMKRDERVNRTDSKSHVKKTRLMPGEKREVTANISASYDITTRGRYVVKAVVEAGKYRYESNAVVLDVVRGIELSSAIKTVPGYSEREREYSLRYHWRDKKEILFLCVYENNGRVNFGVFPLGPLLRVNKPVMNIDRLGVVTVVHQTNRDCFIRSKFESNQDGVFFVEQKYLDAEGKPYAYMREPEPAPR